MARRRQPDFDGETALLPDLIAACVLDDRGVAPDAEWRPWFETHADRRLRYLFMTNGAMRRSLSGPAGRDWAYTYVNHWLDALLHDGFEAYEAKHPLEAIAT